MRWKVALGFALSPDTSTVRFGLDTKDENPVVFDLAAASLDQFALSSRWPRPPAKFDGLRSDGLGLNTSFPKVQFYVSLSSKNTNFPASSGGGAPALVVRFLAWD